MRRPALLVAVLLIGACKPPELLGGMRLVVTVDDSSVACVEVVAQALDTNTVLTGQTDVDGRPELHVGIGETASLTGRLRVTVKGYATPGCTGLPFITLPAQEAELGPPPFEMPLQFRFPRQARDGGMPMDAGVDAGTPDAGEPDAGEPDAGIIDAGVCDLTNCSTTEACQFATCLSNGTCERGDRTSSTPCDGGLCSGGRCVPMTGCAPQQACDAGLSCTRDGVCSDAGVCLPTYASCVAPPCLRSLNVCASDGGCAFAVDPTLIGTACAASNVCYANGECQPLLRADNVRAARLPWPTRPLLFVNGGGACTYGWDTSPGDAGAPLVPPMAGVTCPWPAQLQPTALSQELSGPEVIVFSGTQLRIEPNVTLRFVGRRPVAMLVHGDADLEGLINLRPINRFFPGAGADSALCGVGGTGGTTEGGGGGGFLDQGGTGGRSATSNGGAGNGTDTMRPLRGGCSGGLGFMGVDAGVGGGGFQLTVRGTLRLIDAGIAAPGLGGPGGLIAGNAATAGGGGGSGGAILLQAASVIGLNAFLTANGGGGGEGGTRQGTTNSPGNRGADGALRSTAVAAGGTGANCCGGVGGPGGAGTSPPDGGTSGTTGGGNNPAGGGGGGSRGRIRIDTPSGGSCTLTQTLISPDVTLEGSNTTCIRN
ncbi:MAG: hypothetical protein Q8N26_17305 [Myxococcales bacterium]|nr:hypothetical protein [Myxococcales bacterium]